MQPLLIMSCSAKKRPDAGLLPAIERYDGPAFRVLRRYLAQQPSDCPDTLVLSARFGIVDSDKGIPYYDQRLTAERLQALRPAVTDAIEQRLLAKRYDEVFVCGGSLYTRLLDPALTRTARATIQAATGTSGRRLSELHDWLHGHAPALGHPSAAPPGSERRIRGVDVAMTAEDVYALARQALGAHRGDPARFQSWFVTIDGTRVGPKWLVTQMTGLGPNRFGTNDACRLLARLGIPVERR
jgi:hypothetical protein